MTSLPTTIIGIAGGSASGKTTLARQLGEVIPQAAVIALDSYYRGNSQSPMEERARVNYDHPGSFDFPLLERHLNKMSQGETVSVPIYDFSTHMRSTETMEISSSSVIILEGILVLHESTIRSQLHYSIYVDTPDSLRFSRRLARDVRERGRTEDSVYAQWEQTVQPMFLEYCKPSKVWASRIVDGSAWELSLVQSLAKDCLSCLNIRKE